MKRSPACPLRGRVILYFFGVLPLLFVSALSAQTSDLPIVGIPCYVNGDATSSIDAFVGVLYDPGMGSSTLGGTSDIYHLAFASEIGSTWGAAYQSRDNSFYAGAVIKRHSGLTSNGTGVIFKVPASVDATGMRLGTPSVLINLNGAVVGTGGVVQTGADPHTGPLGGPSSPNVDATAFPAAGTIGLGDIDISADGNTLYAINLNGNGVTTFPELVVIDITNEAAPSVTTTFPINTATTGVSCTDGQLRPWAIEIDPTSGEVLVGCVCSGEAAAAFMPAPPYYQVEGTTFPAGISRITGAVETDVDAQQAKLRGYVFRLDQTAGSYSTALDFPLDANRSNTTLGFFGDWLPWTTNYPGDITTPVTLTVPANGFQVTFPSFDGYPQPIVADLDITSSGDILVSMMDRWGLQTGTNTQTTTGAFGENGRPAGEILRFGPDGSGGWNNTVLSDYGDVMSNFENEVALGGIAYRAGEDEFIGVSVDPTQANSNGLSVIGISPPQSRDVQILVDGTSGSESLVANKGLALGDVEIGVLDVVAGCAITDAGLTAVLCDNATTGTDPADDFITFSLNPVVEEPGAMNTYNVTVSSGTVSPTSATYGAATSFQLQAGSAGGGNVTLTLTDADDPTCSIMVVLTDPGSCSVACNLSIANVMVNCTNGTDFTVSFDVNWDYANAVTDMIEVTVDGDAQAPFTPAGVTGTQSFGPITVTGPAYGLLLEANFLTNTACGTATTVDLIACTPDCVDGPGTVGGNVFNDFNNDGADAGAGEVGQENVLVEVYDCDGVLVCSTYTNADGNWSCSGLTDGEEYRVEFSTPLQPYLQPSFAGDDNGTNVQFVMGGNCNIDYGVYDPAYCLGETDGDANSDDKRVLVTCFVNGAADGAGIEDVLVAFDYDESGSDPTDHLATKSEMGSVWALAYDPARDVAYTSAFTKRHVGMGPNGPGAIYQYDFTTNTTSLFIDLAAAGLDVSGFPDELTRNLGDAGGTSRDPDVFDLVGKTAIGDIDITVDGSTLYAMSLANKTVYEIDVATQSVTNTYASDGPGCTNGEWRPFALKVHEGKVYVGGVCDASNGGTNADLQASVFVLVDGAFIEVVSVPLDYRKGRVHATAAPTLGNWRPWVDAFSDLTVGFNAQNQAGRPVIVHPQPILSDMEFDVDGSLILGFMDRSGHQVGNENLSPGGAANIRWTVISGGDILRAAADGQGGYTLESNGTAGSTTTAGAGNNQGPDGGEFYYGDRFFDADNSLFVHQETSLGGLALLPGTGEVLLSVFDPVNGGSALYGSAGVSKLSNTTGNKDNAAGRIVYTQTDTGTFGKGNGLGDLEIICSPPPIQIGNYAWIDTDEDGIQDACEPPLPDLTVKLYTKPATGDPVLLATTTTDANGNYYFVGDQLDNATWAVSDTIAAGEQYFIAFCGDNAFDETNNTIEVGGVTYCLTTADTGEGTNPDLNDSDATVQDILGAMIPAYCTQPGEVDTTNHTFDVGWKPVITCVQPTVLAFAIQPSCESDGTVNADGYLQISATDGLSYEVNAGSTYDGSGTRTTLLGATFPLQILTGLANPAANQDYTIRIYQEDVGGNSTCFVDDVVTMRVQDCVTGCACNDYLYLNDTGLDYVEKFQVNSSDGSLTEIGDSQNGAPWLDAGAVGLGNPHGIEGDLNGFLFIGSTDNDYIRRVSCQGEVLDNDLSTPVFDNLTNDGFTFNHFTIGNLLYGQFYNDGNNYNSTNQVRIYDLCTGSQLGCQQSLNGQFAGFWGMTNGNDGYWYATGIASDENNASVEGIWRGLVDPAAFDDGSGGCGSFELYRSMADLGLDASTQRIMGITVDDLGNLYTIVTDDSGFNPPSTVLKLTPGGTITTSLTDATIETDPSDNLNWAGARGIVWSQASNRLYVSSQEDCIATFTTDLVYEPSSSVHIQGVFPKGIGIVTECCPTNNNQLIEVVQCNIDASEPIFLNDIYDCSGVICEAQWQPADAASASIYNECNQSIMAGTAAGCYTFTRFSDGTGANNQCGAFVQTFTLEISEVQAAIVGGDQEICEGEDPAAFTVQTAASGSGPLSYQWSVSTQSDSTGFTIIPGATSAVYDPTPADITADTVYFRQVVTVEGCVDGSCADTSNTVIVITVDDCLSLGSTVFVDNNNNGFQDTDDLGIPGVEVQLWDATTMMQILTDANGVPVTNPADAAMVLTDANGDYLFSNLPEGDYYVVIPTAPISAPISSNETSSGFMETDPDDNLDNDDEGVQPGGSGASVSSDTITLTVGDEPTNGTTDGTETAQGNTQDDAFDANGNMTLDFGFFAPVTVGDTTFVDLDGDGLQGPDDAPLGNVTVTVYDNATGMPVTLDAEDMAYTATQTTAADGSYLFENLPPGDYYVEFDLSTADNGLFYDYTTPNAGDDADDSDAVPAAPEDDVASSGPTGFLTSGGSDLTLDAGVQCAITVTVADPFTICSTQPIDLTQNVSISPVSLSFGGSWTSSGNGTFLNSVGGELSDDPDPIAFGEAVTYVPGSQDIRNGFVILTLTTDDPDGPCEPVSASVRIEILKVDCGEFLWDGSNDD